MSQSPQFELCFVAEKPSFARAIADALSHKQNQDIEKRDGYLAIGNVAVTWFFGHMFELAQPKDYGPKWANWTLESLPIIIADDQWKLKIPDDKKQQIGRVRKLLSNSSVIVNAGDAGREGQLLIDEALIEFGLDPFGSNMKRLWVQSMAQKDMLAALNSLLMNADKKLVYSAAVSRQRADYEHGMTFSRFFSISARLSGYDAAISVGRVQTPTLRLVVDRDRERLRFKPTDHFQPNIMFRHEDSLFKAGWVIPADYEGVDSEGRLINKDVAQKICDQISGKTGRVRAFKADPKIKAPPLPFSLSALQTECGSKFGMTAKRVLEVAQSLYEEHKITTYPRSDNRYLPPSILKDEAPSIMEALRSMPSGDQEIQAMEAAAAGADMNLKSGAWDASKIGEHHGIIPTTEFSASKLSRLSPDEKNVFCVIARSFIAQFYPAFRYKTLSADILCEEHQFKATGRLIVDYGWRKVEGKGVDAEDEDGGDTDQTLPVMAVGDNVKAESSVITSKRTSPPSAFNDGTLIDAMGNAHRFETNPELKKRLKEGAGIGTEATRADTIEKLLKRNFLKRKGKNGLESSEFGRSVIDMLPEDLKSLGLTALWDGFLGQIESGKIERKQFMSQLESSIIDRIKSLQGKEVVIRGVKAIKPLPGHGKPCTKCNKGTMVTREGRSKSDGKIYKALACTNYPECKAWEWPEPDIPPLPGHGKTCPKCGVGKMMTREGISKTTKKPYKALACNNYPACSNFEFPDDGKGPKRPSSNVPPAEGHGKTCPECKKGKLITKQFTSKAGKPYIKLMCDQYPACKHGEFPPKKSGAGAGSRGTMT